MYNVDLAERNKTTKINQQIQTWASLKADQNRDLICDKEFLIPGENQIFHSLK